MGDKRAAYRELSKVFPRLFDQTDAAINAMRNIMDRHGVHATELVLADRDEIAELRREIIELQAAVQRQFDTFEVACASKGYVGDAAMAKAVNVEPGRVRNWREIGRVPAIMFHKLTLAPDAAAEKREEQARKRTAKEAARAAREAQREEAKRLAKAPAQGSKAKRLRGYYDKRLGEEAAIRRTFDDIAEKERAAGAKRLKGADIYGQAIAGLGIPVPKSVVSSHVAHFVRLYEEGDPARKGLFRRIEWPVPLVAAAPTREQHEKGSSTRRTRASDIPEAASSDSITDEPAQAASAVGRANDAPPQRDDTCDMSREVGPARRANVELSHLG